VDTGKSQTAVPELLLIGTSHLVLCFYPLLLKHGYQTMQCKAYKWGKKNCIQHFWLESLTVKDHLVH